MSNTKILCDKCTRRFVDANALLQHQKFKHRELFPKSRQILADAMETAIFEAFDMPAPGQSLADLAIEAQRKQRAGEPLEDWEKPYAY